MRITNNMLINNMLNNIGKNLSRMDRYQQQMATGKKIVVPSDDPVVAARALKLRTDVSEVEQYKKNVTDGQSWMEITESSLSSLGDVLQRLRELAVQGSNGSVTSDDMKKINEEVKQLKTQTVHIANSTYAGRYIFSGFKTDKKLMEDNENSINFGKFIVNVDNNENIKYEIGIGDDININATGGDIFNGGIDASTSTAPRLIDNFDKIISALDTGNNTACGNMIGVIDNEMDNLLRVRADVGARQNRLELTSNRLDNDYTNFTKLMSANEDVDMADTIMNLKNEENVYNASLAGGARIIQPSLVDFLR